VTSTIWIIILLTNQCILDPNNAPGSFEEKVLEEQTMEPISQLTEQERAVLALLAIGQRNASIADELSISTRTVENHLYHIFRKLGVSSRIEAAVYALRNDLFSKSEMSGITQDG
jgi:DNA-binding NarL/FixJ family response regulator